MLTEISIIGALIAGFLSFFAPCVLPLLPPYFSWLFGVSKKDLKKDDLRLRIFLHSFFLVLGFSIVFIALGSIASSLGKFLAGYRLIIQRIGGIIIILFGLEFAGFLRIFKNYQANLIEKLFSRFNKKIGSFVVGSIFAFAWVACFSPILGSILVLASFQETLNQGIILLGFYSLGLAIPFLLSALFFGVIIERVKDLTKIFKWLNLFSGLALIILGILFLTDDFYKLVSWLSKVI